MFKLRFSQKRSEYDNLESAIGFTVPPTTGTDLLYTFA